MLRVICLVGLTVTMLSGCSNLHQKNDGNRELAVCETSAADWKQELLSGGILEADLNGDGLADRVKLEYAEQEGSRFISEFECEIKGISNLFALRNYDAELEKMEVFDFNEDGLNEILFLYDTHGTGGAGTHDIYVLWTEQNEQTEEKFLKIQKLQPDVSGRNELEEDWNVDGIYSLEKCIYNNMEKIAVRQYIYGKDGHADHIGDVVSVVSLQENSSCFQAEESWIEVKE